MHSDKIALIIVWIVTTALWSMSIWGGWAEKTYDKFKHKDNTWYWNKTWYWLKLFNKPLTRENWIKFIKATSIAGIIIQTIMTILILMI